MKLKASGEKRGTDGSEGRRERASEREEVLRRGRGRFVADKLIQGASFGFPCGGAKGGSCSCGKLWPERLYRWERGEVLFSREGGPRGVERLRDSPFFQEEERGFSFFQP